MKNDLEPLKFLLNNQEKLLSHQLLIQGYLSEKLSQTNEKAVNKQMGHSIKHHQAFQISDKIVPHNWQINALKVWATNEYHGIIKVVTGAGKTVFSLLALSQLKSKIDGLITIITVPTITLMNQWYDVLIKLLGLKENMISRRGGGFTLENDKNTKVIIYVIPSARKYLFKDLQKFNQKRLLIADECHHLNSTNNTKILKNRFDFTLGLSATPENQHIFGSPENEGITNTLIGHLGKIIFEYGYHESIEDGIIPKFLCYNIAIKLNFEEMTKYNLTTNKLSSMRKEIFSSNPSRSKNMINILKFGRSSQDEDFRRLVMNYEMKLRERKSLLYEAKNRITCLHHLIKNENDKQIIIFHERVTEAFNIFISLRKLGHRVIFESSQMTYTDRRKSLKLFKQGLANILVSIKTLVEGFDAPKADVGIIVASSSSIRQRIQTIGRILRKSQGKKDPKIYAIYAKNTIDESIFKYIDWKSLLGIQTYKFLEFKENSGILQDLQNPPSFIPKDSDLKNLQIGSKYPGRYEGTMYSLDTQGNIFKWIENKRYQVEIESEILHKLKESLKNGGAFKITDLKKYVLVLDESEFDESEIIFLGQLNADVIPLETQDEDKSEILKIKVIKNKRYLCRKLLSFEKKNQNKVKTTKYLPAEETDEVLTLLNNIEKLSINLNSNINDVEYNQSSGYVIYRWGGKIHEVGKLHKTKFLEVN